MKDIETVTSILRYKNKILILKRSGGVRYYKHCWAGVCGYLNESEPLEKALQEIEEETGIPRNELKLVKKEKVVVPDNERGINWNMNVFLFDSNTDVVDIDWEHVDYKWINKDELDNFETLLGMNRVVQELLG